ncbi:hypothetical protein WCLP8_1100009 [uncultured Gammaproteobacteria bacterium]
MIFLLWFVGINFQPGYHGLIFTMQPVVLRLIGHRMWCSDHGVERTIVILAIPNVPPSRERNGFFGRIKGLVRRVETRYIMGVIDVPFAVAIRPRAIGDLLTIRVKDRPAAVAIAHWLQRLVEDQEVVERLSGPESEYDEISVAQYQELQNLGLNVWLLKLKDNKGWLPYRILYARDEISSVIHVLGVVARPPFKYDLSDPMTKECIHEIEALGIPRHLAT